LLLFVSSIGRVVICRGLLPIINTINTSKYHHSTTNSVCKSLHLDRISTAALPFPRGARIAVAHLSRIKIATSFLPPKRLCARPAASRASTSSYTFALSHLSILNPSCIFTLTLPSSVRLHRPVDRLAASYTTTTLNPNTASARLAFGCCLQSIRKGSDPPTTSRTPRPPAFTLTTPWRPHTSPSVAATIPPSASSPHRSFPVASLSQPSSRTACVANSVPPRQGYDRTSPRQLRSPA